MVEEALHKPKFSGLRVSGFKVFACLAWLAALLTVSQAQAEEFQPDEQLLKLLKNAVNDAESFEDRYDAEVWLLSKSGQLERFVPDRQERLDLLKLIHQEATRAGIEPEVVLAVIEIESHFDRYAISRVGAQGMMQIMPFWKKEIGRPNDNLMDTATNLRYGCTILKYYLDMEKGHLYRALARYNGSYGKYWYPRKVMAAWENRWR